MTFPPFRATTIEVLEERLFQQHEAIMSAVDGVNKRLDRLNGSVQAANDRIEVNRRMITEHIQEPGHAKEIQRLLDQEMLLTHHSDRFTEMDKKEAIEQAIIQDRQGVLDEQELRHKRQLGVIAVVSGIMTCLLNFGQVVKLINGVIG